MHRNSQASQTPVQSVVYKRAMSMHLGHGTFLSISWLYFTQQYSQLTSHSITVGGERRIDQETAALHMRSCVEETKY